MQGKITTNNPNGFLFIVASFSANFWVPGAACMGPTHSLTRSFHDNPKLPPGLCYSVRVSQASMRFLRNHPQNNPRIKQRLPAPLSPKHGQLKGHGGGQEAFLAEKHVPGSVGRAVFTTVLNQEEWTQWRDVKHEDRKVRGVGEGSRSC